MKSPKQSQTIPTTIPKPPHGEASVHPSRCLAQSDLTLNLIPDRLPVGVWVLTSAFTGFFSPQYPPFPGLALGDGAAALGRVRATVASPATEI